MKMMKMELVVMSVLLMQLPLLLLILWRTEVSVRLLKKQIKAAELEKSLLENGMRQENEKRDSKSIEKISQEEEGNINIRKEEGISSKKENCEKEKLINEVLSEIFS